MIGICRQCEKVNRLPQGWRVFELVCGKCGGPLRRPADKESDLQPVTMAAAPPGRPPLKPDKAPPPAEDVPGQLAMFPGEGVRCE